MFNRILKCAVTLAVCVPTLASAQTPTVRRDGAWEFSVGAGVITIDRAFASSVLVPMGIQDALPSRIAPGIAGRVGYQFNRNIGLSLGAMAGKGSGATIVSPFVALTASPNINARTSPFITMGVGVTRFSTGSSAVFTPARAVHETASWGAHLGLGLRSMISERVAIRLEGRMQYEKYEELDSISGKPAYNGFATLGLSYFTRGRVVRDADGDGVADRRDRCANTPRGAQVDENGCPLDSDRDGVADGLDRCPNTPANTPVDANGCPRDSDADGVTDNIDRCPNTPANTRVDANGCPRDTDGDGVADNLDRCPNSPAGSLVNANGCPRDSDGDGVADNLDRCPNSPPGRPVNSSGCTTIVLPANAADQMVLRVQFVTNRSSLVPASTAILDSVAVAILDSPGSLWEVQGFTDIRGTVRANRILSQARAQAVVDYLVSKGVPRESMTATGFASERAVGSNVTAEGQAANRRVQLRRRPAANPTPLP